MASSATTTTTTSSSGRRAATPGPPSTTSTGVASGTLSATPPSAGAAIPRRRIEEALLLFAELERAPVVDDRDAERFRLVSAPPSSDFSKTMQPPRSRSTVATAAGGARPQPPPSSSTTADLQRQLQVADECMKKLHAKNQRLLAEVAQLKAQQQQQGGVSASSMPPSAPTAPPPSSGRRVGAPAGDASSALTEQLRSRDARIAELEAELRRREKEGGGSSRVGMTKAAPLGGAAAPPAADDSSHRNLPLSDAVALERLRNEQLRAQLDEVLKANLDCIAQGEATGKVNKEVKSFFVAMRAKQQVDQDTAMAERLLVNKRLLEVEAKLCDLECGSLPQPGAP